MYFTEGREGKHLIIRKGKQSSEISFGFQNLNRDFWASASCLD